MKDRFIKWFMAIHMLMLRLSYGRLGGKLGTQVILILHTIGRTSGQERAIPVAYFNYEGGYLIVASNWGKDKNPDGDFLDQAILPGAIVYALVFLVLAILGRRSIH